MASQLQLRRGTTAQHATFIGAPAEATVDINKKTLVVHDGTTVGGFPVLSASGGTMTGPVSMGGSKITSLATPTAPADAAPKGYIDGLVAAATLADADYGDITVSGGATVWTIDNGAVTETKIADSAVTTAKIIDDAVTTAKIANGTIVDANISAGAAIAASKFSTAAQQALVPAGAVMPFAMNSAPSGWLAANGDAVSRSTYAALFSAIGTTHGSGDGSTTFNLPDLRGIFVRGSGSQTIDGTTYTGTFAAKQQDDLKSHTHTVVARGNSAVGNFAAGSFPSAAETLTTSPTGGDETRPANIALLYCIKH